MKNKNWIWIIILAVLLVAGVVFLLVDSLGSHKEPQLSAETTQPTQTQETTQPTQTQEATEPTEKKKALAPDFTVYDREGNPVKLSDFRGKTVVLNFWSSNCGPCRMEMPDFEVLYQELGEEVHFLMVNLTDGSWDTVESASDFVAQNQYTFPVYYDTDLEASYAYRVTSIPTTYFIDAEGYGVAYGSGVLDEAAVRQGIEMAEE